MNVGSTDVPELDWRLPRDIHLIAYYYHWTMEAIKKLPYKERQKFISLIADQVNRENGEKADGEV